MLQKQKLFKFLTGIGIGSVIFLFMIAAGTLEAQDVKSVLFKDATTSMQKAKNVHADILAPDNFSKGMEIYKEAEQDLKDGDKLADISKNLRESIGFFNKAINATKLAEVAFPNSMKARRDAQYTEAARFSPKNWKEAEEKFNDAARELEDGDVQDAKEEAREAEVLYRKAELEAIKSNYLDETRKLLKHADQQDVDDYAPKTLLNAQQLVKQAEKELSDNRYDTDVARSLALQANYQVKHAIYLAKVIKQMEDKNNTWEDLMLASEKPLQQIADKANLVVSFDNGSAQATNEIIESVIINQDKVDQQSQELDWYQQGNVLQNARIAELEKQFGSQTKEKSALAEQIANQAKIRKQFTMVEQSFNSKEARVLREGNDVIIRLVGLNFPSAKATIEQKSFGLLTKVRDAINNYPECTISVLGYTDSHGGDAQNLVLSTERAESVKQYLVANSTIDASVIETIGYGESKPIVNNETEVNRAINRRVEVIIHPWNASGEVTVQR
jgi:outer membrane protein OmpA-like peptidoglycan-associated protein